MDGLSEDLLANTVSRVDALALAAVACTCSDLRDIARDQTLWKKLCHSSWPSTSLPEAQHLISSSFDGGFKKFYADACPLLVYDNKPPAIVASNNSVAMKSDTSPSNLVSLVDVFYKNKCVLSKVLDGMPEALDNSVGDKSVEASDERQIWFLNYPFKLELLDNRYDHYQDDAECEYESLSDLDHEKSSKDLCKELIDDIRLSWVVVDKKAGKAVNLSSWKPVSVRRGWPYHGEYVMHFGSVVAVEGEVALLLASKLARPAITTRFKLIEGDQCPQWKEIGIHIESVAGTHLNGRASLVILNQALYSSRSTNHLKVEQGLQRYESHKTELLKKRQFKDTFADSLYLFIQIALGVIFFYSFF